MPQEEDYTPFIHRLKVSDLVDLFVGGTSLVIALWVLQLFSLCHGVKSVFLSVGTGFADVGRLPS